MIFFHLSDNCQNHDFRLFSAETTFDVTVFFFSSSLLSPADKSEVVELSLIFFDSECFSPLFFTLIFYFSFKLWSFSNFFCSFCVLTCHCVSDISAFLILNFETVINLLSVTLRLLVFSFILNCVLYLFNTTVFSTFYISSVPVFQV